MTIAIPSLRAITCTPQWVRNDLWRRARAVPSLDLRFADSKSLVDAVTGQSLITFTRASSGTYVGSDGLLKTAATNEPRFDHNPLTGESLGLLVEEQRTNLLLRSEEFDDASWILFSGSLATNSLASPNGLTTADTYTATAGLTTTIHQVVSCTASTTYTFSFYARLGTLPAADFRIAVRDDSNATFIAQDVIPSITPVTTEWRRIAYTFTTPVGCTLVRPYLIRFSSSSGGTIHFWGAQLEAGAFPTSYIPTTGSAVTRNADVATITGTAFSRWYNAVEGTFYAEVQTAMASSVPGVFTATASGITNNRIDARLSQQSFVSSGGSVVANLVSGPALAANTAYKLALGCRVDDFTRTTNAAAVSSDTSGAMPVGINQLEIGNIESGTFKVNGPISRLTYWPTRLGNSVLQAITQ